MFIFMGTTVTWASSPTFDLASFKNDRAVTDAAQYEINGSVFDGAAKLTINGQPAAIDGMGNFKASEKLNEGDNTFVLLAINAKGDRKTQETFTGEYCRITDHGAVGIAGDGERISCEDNKLALGAHLARVETSFVCV